MHQDGRAVRLTFSQVMFENRELLFVANPHLRLAAIAFEAADRLQPGALSHRRIGTDRTMKLDRYIAQLVGQGHGTASLPLANRCSKRTEEPMVS